MNAEVVIEIIKKQGSVSAADLRQAGVARTTLHYMASRGILRRVTRGVYTLAGHYLTFEAFAGIMTSAPRSVICLLSALQFHEITTQMPFETWVAIESNASRPKSPNVRIVKLTGKAFSEGIEAHQKEGVYVRVYCPAKTVVDCFKFRNTIGLDVAREALIDCLHQKKATRDEIWKYAVICRMANIMRPYLEMAQ
ncbi:MAG: type IV toxin-antitoxin system AbiEi family antitoxin domain-containing protein [Phycisphaeraceae bacterium]|nr:type IV toxin-antitoxin system AbiEi family antitoxin domain-containing protein [Phycisphaeraceae bacterium]